MNRQDLTLAVVNAAIKVHRRLGAGFEELIYQRALAIELQEREILFLREVPYKIFYRNQCVGVRRVDFLIGGFLMVEIKAVACIGEVHYMQVLNYLRSYELSNALLLNFGEEQLKYREIQPVS